MLPDAQRGKENNHNWYFEQMWYKGWRPPVANCHRRCNQDQPCCTQIQAAINAMAPHTTSTEDIQRSAITRTNHTYCMMQYDRSFCALIALGDNSGTVTAKKSQCLPFQVFPTRKIPEVLLLQDNASTHNNVHTTTAIRKFGWIVLIHPPYSSDLTPPDFYLFAPLTVYKATITRTGTAECHVIVAAE